MSTYCAIKGGQASAANSNTNSFFSNEYTDYSRFYYISCLLTEMANYARAKKIVGIILIIIFAPIELILLFMVLSSPYLNSGVSPRSMILNLLFPMILLAFPLVFGVRIWLAAKRTLRAIPTLLGTEKISIGSSVSLPEYLWLMWKIVYTNLIWIYVHLILSGVLVIYMLRNESPGIQITILVIFAMSPLTTYVNGKREYKSSTLLHHDALFEFDAQNFTIISGASTFAYPWNSIFKIREIGNFLLVYKEKQTVYIISRANISSRADIDTIRAFAIKNNVRVE